MHDTFPRLIADIGGTNARFAIEVAPMEYEYIQNLICKEHKSFASVVQFYISKLKLEQQLKGAVFAIPTPEHGDTVFMVNSPWNSFSLKNTSSTIGIPNTIFINDFHALALSIPFIKATNLIQIGGGDLPDLKKPIAIIGPGTGLGMATLIKHPTGDYYAIPAEGGRSSFPPVNDEEIELWRFVHKRFSHVSAERFVSGPGLQLIYEGLCYLHNILIDTLPSPEQIAQLGIEKKSWLCVQTLDIFCRMLGTVASNLAVTVNSFGGVYLGGGIVPKMLDFFINSDFRSRFEDKGRYRPFLAKMPVYVINQDFAAFYGASYALDIYMKHFYIP